MRDYFSAILTWDYAYPRRLTGRTSNGDEISLEVCPEDNQSVQLSFGVNEARKLIFG